MASKRPQAELDMDGEVDEPRCKRQPPPSPDLHSFPPAVLPDAEAAGQVQGRRSPTPRTALLALLETAPSAFEGTEPLTHDENLDVQLLLIHHPTSKRGAGALDSFVGRAFERRGDAEAERPAAMAYFWRVGRELETAGRDAGRDAATARANAVAVYDAMVKGWQNKAAAWLGSSIGSVERLAVVIDRLVRCAEELGGLVTGSELRAPLEQFLAAATVSTSMTGPDASGTWCDLIGASSVVRAEGSSDTHAAGFQPAEDADGRDAHVLDAEGRDAEIGDVGTQDAGMQGLETQDGETQSEECREASIQRVDAPQPPLAKRFPDPRSLFAHHARMVKRTVLGDGWKKKGLRRAAKAEIDEEWGSLPSSMQKVWAAMHAALLDGDKYLIDEGAADALFIDGHAQTSSTAVHVDAASRPAHSHSLGRSSEASGQPAPKPPRSPPFKPIKTTFAPVDDPEQTVYMHVSMKVESADVIHACRTAASRYQDGKVNGEAWHVGRSVWVVSFTSLKTARNLANKPALIRKKPHHVYPFPTAPPQMFVAQLDAVGTKTIDDHAVYASLARTFPRDAFHLRKENSPAVSRLAWLVVFEKPLGLLRFTAPMQQASSSWKNVQFEPVMRASACPVCNGGHRAPKCPSLTPMSPADLGVDGDHARYLLKSPRVAV